LVTFLKTKPLDFSPGTQWSYSNSGYRLLGYIIQKVTGISYENAVKKFIFDPLKMTHSGFDFKYLSDKNKTTGYEIFGDEIKKEAVVYDPPGPFAAGAIYSTIGDLYKYHKGLQAFKIVAKETLKRAYTIFKNNYGYGWMIRSYEGMDIVSHSGGAAGYRSNFVRIPKEDICIILLNNTENANVEHISKNLVNVLINKPYKVPAEIKLGKEVLTKYVGYYAINPTFTMYITMDNGRLAAQATGQGKAAVFAQKENYFLADEADGFLEFPKDDKGMYNELIIHQGGRNISAKRIYPAWGLIGTATS
jgi:CubicO group peptidase (beta-lactamase class C family)